MQKLFQNRVLAATLLFLRLLITDSPLNAQTIAEIVYPTLNKGVNLSFLEHYWVNPTQQYNQSVTPKLEAIAGMGFKTLRLPVALDHFTKENSTELDPRIIQKIKQIMDDCNRLHLKLIVVYHYGRLRNDNVDLENDRIIRMWKQLMAALQFYDNRQLFFELYNEPTTDMSVWKSAANTLVRELRKEDANRIFIIGGANYNGANEILDMGKLDTDDGKLIYTFHFYEPYIFTHQGADWTKEKTFLTGFPYPYNPFGMPPAPSPNDFTEPAKDYRRYYREATKTYLTNRLTEIKKRAQQQRLPLICTEAGVINFADSDSKSNYLRDLTAIMEELNIPLSLWDYDDKFSLIQQKRVIRSVKKWLR